MRVCVFAASSNRVDERYYQAAGELGRLLAISGMEVIYGGGGIGLMGKLADAVLKNNGKITGVIPRFMQEEGWDHSGVTEMIVTENMSQRKQEMTKMADAIVALPGGIGTLEELTEAITLKQLGLFKGPIVIMNTLDFYDRFISFLNQMVQENFMRKVHLEIWTVVKEPAEVIDAIKNYKGWYDDPRKFSKID